MQQTQPSALAPFTLAPVHLVRHRADTEITHNMHVTACLAEHKEDVEVGEDCRTLQTLKEAIVVALPQLWVEGFDVSVGGRALDDDEGVVSLVDSACLDVAPNPRGVSVRALREAGREVSEAGLLDAAAEGDALLCPLYLDAGVPIDCVDGRGNTPLHRSCWNGLWKGGVKIGRRNGCVLVATLLLDRGSRAIDEKDVDGRTPLHLSCINGLSSVATLLLDRGSRALDEKDSRGNTPLHVSCATGNLEAATLLLDRGSRAIDEKNGDGNTPLHLSCVSRHLSLATLLLDRGSRAIDEADGAGETPILISCTSGHWPLATLLLDRGCDFDFDDETYEGWSFPQGVSELLSERRRAVQAGADDASLERVKRRRIGEP